MTTDTVKTDMCVHSSHSVFIVPDEWSKLDLRFRVMCRLCGNADSDVSTARRLVLPCTVNEDSLIRRCVITVSQATPPHALSIKVEAAPNVTRTGSRQLGVFRVAFRGDGVKFGHMAGHFGEYAGSWASTLVNFARVTMAKDHPEYYQTYVRDAGQKIFSVLAHNPQTTEVPLQPVRVHVGLAVINNGRLLVVRRRGEPVWSLPGGEPRQMETDIMALRRCIAETLQVTPIIADADYVGVVDETVNQGPVTFILLYVGRMPEDFQNSMTASGEVETFTWHKPYVNDGSVLAPSLLNQVIPRLANLFA